MIPGSLYQPTILKRRGPYQIANSLRLNSADSAYLTRTPASAGNRRKWTFSFWVKRSKLSTDFITLYSTAGYSNDDVCRFVSGDSLDWYLDPGGAAYHLQTNALFRDVTAWYHIMLVVDTTNATASNRMQIYVNGSQVTSLAASSYPTQNYDTITNTTVAHDFGRRSGLVAGSYYDGYMSEIYFVDGQALTPSSFGKTDAYGNWIPIKYSGTYGTNGFYLEFKNSAALGTDTSGNSNTFTSSGLASNDQVTDTPTNVFATWNPLDFKTAATLTDGNLVLTQAAASYAGFQSSLALPSSGKYAFKITVTVGGASTAGRFGLCSFGASSWTNAGMASSQGPTTFDAIICYQDTDGYLSRINSAGSDTNNGSASVPASADYFEFLRDADAGTVLLKKNGSTVGTASSIPAVPLFVFASAYNGRSYTIDFGQSGYTPSDASYKTLCTSNLAAPTIKDGSAHFQTTLYTGTGATKTVTQSGNSTFTPGLVWIKDRSNIASHALYDVIRGVNKQHSTDNDNAQLTSWSDLVTAFNSNGFSLGADATVNNVNVSTHTYAAWQFKGGGAGVTNTSGSITSTVSANPTAGFSIVKWTGTGSAGTIGHGLNSTPKLILVHDYSNGNIWQVYHASIGNGNYLVISSTAASAAGSDRWNSTSPTSTVFSVGNNGNLNSSGNSNIAYCFAEIEGFCKIGSYTGNGSADGPFIYTGFTPAFVLWKNASATGDWYIKDIARDTYNPATLRIYPNSSAAEDPNATNDLIDIVFNGFKVRSASNAATNGSGNTIIYIAFALRPFGGIGVSPATAR